MSSQPPDRETRVGHNLVALAGWLPIVGGLTAGVAGLVVGLNQPGTTPGGVYLVASALAFGLLANAILRR